tara:strand:- start:1224 stop:1373 length:150 start_codon:yes stop_codon:yes gene_type:complete
LPVKINFISQAIVLGAIIMSTFNHIGLLLVPSAVKKIIAKNADNKNPIQ